MQKNIIIACGLGDLFIFLTRLDDFFARNKEYDSIKFWTWLHRPLLAKELVSLDSHKVSIYSVEEMNDYLREYIPEKHLTQAESMFISQTSTGSGVDAYMQFMARFFPNLEEWVYLPTYSKYKGAYPYKLEKAPICHRDRPYIVVHPFSSMVKTEKPERTWTPARWGHIMRMLRDYYNGVDIIIIGGDSDKIEKLSDFPKGLIDLRGKTSITDTVGLVYGAKAVVGINSWPALISTWAGIPTYTQWFVQHQLIPSHHPNNYKNMDHLVIDHLDNNSYPTTELVWTKIRDLIDARVTI